jgi:hypothetical protein
MKPEITLSQTRNTNTAFFPHIHTLDLKTKKKDMLVEG